MSELLDVFDDEGLVDPETRGFLVEALANAEVDEWSDILEPFLNPEPAMAVLKSVPNVIQRSLKALEPVAAALMEEDMMSVMFLQSLSSGVIAALGLQTVARCSRLCRSARTVSERATYWTHWIERVCAAWQLPSPSLPNASWREKLFSLMHPRADGVYVGECFFQRWQPVGHHIALHKNSAGLTAHGGRGGHFEKMLYRRYVRILLPDAVDGTSWAFVLRDLCARKLAEQVLSRGVDPHTHVNAERIGAVENDFSSHGNDIPEPERVKQRVCVGRCRYTKPDECVIQYTNGGDEYHMTFRLRNAGPPNFAHNLEWMAYTMTPRGGQAADVVDYDLGYLEEWKGGGLRDPDKNHFPPLRFIPQRSLEHLL
jgi:hypothetical protein